MIGLKRILVPTDFSETSEAALRYGVALASGFKAQLYLLHVPEHPGRGAEAEFPIGLFETMQNAAYDRLGHLLTEAEARELGKTIDEIRAWEPAVAVGSKKARRARPAPPEAS